MATVSSQPTKQGARRKPWDLMGCGYRTGCRLSMVCGHSVGCCHRAGCGHAAVVAWAAAPHGLRPPHGPPSANVLQFAHGLPPPGATLPLAAPTATATVWAVATRCANELPPSHPPRDEHEGVPGVRLACTADRSRRRPHQRARSS